MPISFKPFKHECGHYCSDYINKKHCCRCQNPANGYRFPLIYEICKICKGVMKKEVDGFYFQKCRDCGKIVQTTHRGKPVLAPLSGCGCKVNKIKRGSALKNGN